MTVLPPSRPLVCEVLAISRADARSLAAIALTCARDLGVPVRTLVRSQAGISSTLTLHLPAELAVEQHPVWCLACRLACFCPTARVSVLVQAATGTFGKRRRRTGGLEPAASVA